MRFSIIVSEKDPAGMTIKGALEERNIPVITVKKESVSFDACDTLDTDFLIFATKHQSKKGVPSLCTHAVGNWGIAELGGKEKTLGIAPAHYLKRALQLLEEKNALGWEVFQEATHHGPFSRKPILFLEIGSTEKEYCNKAAGRIIADVILELLSFQPHRYIPALGIGGLHHTPNFKKIQLQTEIAIGHVCPKYNLQFLSKDMLIQAMDKTDPQAQIILLDWKGLGSEKERIKKIVDDVVLERKIKIMKTNDF